MTSYFFIYNLATGGEKIGEKSVAKGVNLYSGGVIILSGIYNSIAENAPLCDSCKKKMSLKDTGDVDKDGCFSVDFHCATCQQEKRSLVSVFLHLKNM